MSTNDTNLSLQDTYLTVLIKKKAVASVFLLNGIRLTGQIKHFDADVILMTTQQGVTDQIIYKHNVCSILVEASTHT